MKENSFKILLVDDEPDILEILSYNLKNEGFQIYTANNGDEGIKKAKKLIPDLIILDVMMPDIDGVKACKTLREIDSLNNTIIVFFTARSEDYSQLAGYDAGADDYITKPIKPKLLISKVKALLRRNTKNKSENNIIKTTNLVINKNTYSVTQNKQIISLPRKEFKLLHLLVTNKDKVVLRETIMNKVWGTDVVVGNRTIDVHIRKLRKKIGDNFFKTIKGVGYKFEDEI
jgi:two-component system alkaline phosphatase synthesis response regulator PhoP